MKPKILPLLNNDDESRAYAINDNGRIAGWYASEEDKSDEAVLWDGNKIYRLGTLGGRVGSAYALIIAVKWLARRTQRRKSGTPFCGKMAK